MTFVPDHLDRPLRTGIFGGSFNPIHTGHIGLGRHLLRKGEVDELWYVVSPLNPFKQGRSDLLDDAARLRLAQIATAPYPGLSVCDIEMQLPRPSYMVNTLAALRRLYPQRQFILIIGADNWERFPQWKDSEEILRHHELLIYPRPDTQLPTTPLPQGIRSVPSPLFNISSTEIRQQIAQGTFKGRGLPPAVRSEITRQGYYRHPAPSQEQLH